jgi:hypothetical protein
MDTFAGSNEDPLSLHKYLYAENNPINNSDPSGNDELADISIATTIGAGLDSTYNGVDTSVGGAVQATIIGVSKNESENQILAENAIGAVGGLVLGKIIGKVVGAVDEAIFGGEAEFIGSEAPAAKAAVVEGAEESAANVARRAQLGGYGNVDLMLPVELEEDGYLFSTTKPENIKHGLGVWFTDIKGIKMSAMNAGAYQRGVQINYQPRTIYAYKIKVKTPGAYGYARANAGAQGANGPGGYPQYFIVNQDVDNLEPLGRFEFSN